ncbi:MAG: carboxypeptidase regulatory-like domain-containing protein [Planctomycetes bacterium]|nr:carboxypeptidase regulatory-like domain-containing protein [Planctomycetota bacterium]
MDLRRVGTARTPLVALCAVLALAGVAGWWIFTKDANDAPKLVAPKSGNADSATLPAPVAAGRNDAVREEVATPAPVAPVAGLDLDSRPPPQSFLQELSGLKGRLVEEDGTPVPALRVDLLQLEIDLLMATIEGGFGQPPPRFRDPIIGTTQADADGRFTLTNVESGNLNLLVVDLGGGRATVRLIEQGLARGQTTELGDIVLPPHVVLVGKVEDEDGAPVADARLRVLPELPGQAQVPPQILQMGVTDIRSDVTAIVAFDEFRGQFPVPAPFRFLLDHLPIPTARTQADGTFRIPGVPAGVVTVMADRAGLLGTARAHPTGKRPESSVPTLRMGHGLSVSGTLTAGAMPIEGAKIIVGSRLPLGQLLGMFTPLGGDNDQTTAADAVAIGHPAGATDAAGAFALRGLPDLGEVLVSVQRQAGDPWTVLGPFPGDQPVRVELPPETSLQVAVSDMAGRPVSGVDFRFREAQTGDFADFLFEPHELRGRVTEVEAGKYVARQLPVGRWQVLARAPAYGIGAAEVELTQEGAEPVLIQLPGAQTLVVNVRDAAAAPIDYALVTALAEFEYVHVMPFTAARADAEGRATLQGLPLGRKVALRGRHPGFARGYVVISPEQLAGGQPVDLVLHKGGDFVGRITTQGEPPAKPLMLTISGRDRDDDIAESEMPRFGLTASDGTFAVRHLPAGKYRYSVFGRFLAESPTALIKRIATDAEPDTLAEGEFVIEEGQETRVEIEALPDVPMEPATLSGVVRVAGTRVSGGRVQLSGRRWNQEKLDERGEFTFGELRPGRYRVEILGDREMGGTVLFNEELTLGLGEVRQLDIDARLTEQLVRVTLPDGSPAPHVMVHAVAQRSEDPAATRSMFGGSSGSARGTNDKGEVTLQLLLGSYSLIGSSDEHGRGKATCEVRAAAGEPVTIVMEPGIPCAGRVVAEGVDLAARRGEDEWEWHLYLSPLENEDDVVGFNGWAQLRPPDFTFAVKNAAPGRYQAMLWGPGNDMQQIEFELPPGGASELVLRFKPRD